MISKIAVVMTRLVGLEFVFYGLNYLTYLPERLFSANNLRTAVAVEHVWIEVRWLVIRAVLHVLVGLCLCFLAPSVARALTEDLGDGA